MKFTSEVQLVPFSFFIHFWRCYTVHCIQAYIQKKRSRRRLTLSTVLIMWIQPPSQLPASYICLTFLIVIHALCPKKGRKMWENAASEFFLSLFPILTPSLAELKRPVFSHKITIRWGWKHMLLVGRNNQIHRGKSCDAHTVSHPAGSLFRPICSFNISSKPVPEGHRFSWLPLILLSKHPYDAFSTFGLAQCWCSPLCVW